VLRDGSESCLGLAGDSGSCPGPQTRVEWRGDGGGHSLRLSGRQARTVDYTGDLQHLLFICCLLCPYCLFIHLLLRRSGLTHHGREAACCTIEYACMTPHGANTRVRKSRNRIPHRRFSVALCDGVASSGLSTTMAQSRFLCSTFSLFLDARDIMHHETTGR
jgi:hypothetical protein